MLILVMVEYSDYVWYCVSVSYGADIQCTEDHTGWSRVAAIIAGKSTFSLVTDYLTLN